MLEKKINLHTNFNLKYAKDNKVKTSLYKLQVGFFKNPQPFQLK